LITSGNWRYLLALFAYVVCRVRTLLLVAAFIPIIIICMVEVLSAADIYLVKQVKASLF
jgi:hypothetical protein